MTAFGTKRTNWAGLIMSADWRGPESVGGLQTGAPDAEQTSEIRSHFSGSKGSWCSHIAARPFRVPGLLPV
jgi:hypothetical protein